MGIYCKSVRLDILTEFSDNPASQEVFALLFPTVTPTLIYSPDWSSLALLGRRSPAPLGTVPALNIGYFAHPSLVPEYLLNLYERVDNWFRGCRAAAEMTLGNLYRRLDRPHRGTLHSSHHPLVALPRPGGASSLDTVS